jgi:CRISPR-associated endonuclease/helicase Cas3
MSYREFFAVATNGHAPFRFQEDFRAAEEPFTVLKAPTGLGKTDTALCSWLHQRATEPGITPRRLIWCLPGRALTEQVAALAKGRIKRLVSAELLEPIRVCRLLSGSADNDLTLRPDEPAVLVGTQDILLSRALNRGYARRPFRWPIDFALLNNDCFWVFDEVQLLGDGLATSTQLGAFRKMFAAFGAARSCWISATLDPAWLRTVDFSGHVRVIEPHTDDLKNEIVQKRIGAEKLIEIAPASCRLPAGVASFVAAEHRPGTLTLVIANTVRRAVEIRRELTGKTGAELRLLHSRFRAADRKAQAHAVMNVAVPKEGRIVVTTQVIEAGIDLDATLMVSDLAPYASMVQRFGRVNRKGDGAGSRIFWVDRPLSGKRKEWAFKSDWKPKEMEEVCAPYDVQEIERAAAILGPMTSGSPADLPQMEATAAPWKHVLRRADLLDLFDTSTDLGGNEIDISRFVRSDPERDVYVLWRDWQGDVPREDSSEIDEGELCPAPIGDLDKVAAKVAWCWNSVSGAWVRPENIYPGLVLLMHAKEGKYTTEYGWSADSKVPVTPATSADSAMEKNDADANSFRTYRQGLEDHTEQVYAAMQTLIASLASMGVEQFRTALESAARYHDWGKAHPVMQETLHGGPGPYPELLAKQERGMGNKGHRRRFFRHELASALAMIAAGHEDLSAYVAAAHHGRVRLVIRSMPGDRDAGGICVRGIHDDDALLECSLGSGVTQPESVLTLAPVLLGSDSWTERALRLRDQWGPFRLAYLEMLLRAADEEASAKGPQ